MILFFSCSKKRESDLPRLIGTTSDDDIEVNSKEMLNVYVFNPLAFNFTKNTIIKDISKRYDFVRVVKIPFDSVVPKFDLKVFIDTTYIISNSHYEHKFVSRPDPNHIVINGMLNNKIPNEFETIKANNILFEYINKVSELREDKVKCLPVLVLNNSNEDTCLKVEFIQEARDIDGKWKPIEFTFEYEMCGTGKQFQSILDPKKYAAFSMIKYFGDFKTKIRVKLKNNNHIYYSNEINGKINRSQFNKDFCNSFLESYGSNIDKSEYDYYKKAMYLEN